MSERNTSLHQHVANLISEVKALCPEAAIEVSYQPYETEDAHLVVHPPDSWTLDQCETLFEETATLMSDLLISTGFSVPILIIEPQERVREEKEAFLAARQRKAS